MNMDEIPIDDKKNRSMHIPRQLGEYYVQKKIIEVDNSVLVACNDPDSHGDKLAIKCVPMRLYDTCKREPEIMESINHRNVMKIKRSFLYPPENPRFFAIVMPRACGDLIDYLPRDGSPVPELIACKIMKDSLEGLKAIHAENICHRDIKLDNIFILKETKYGPKCVIGDFGFAIQMDGDEIIDEGCGTRFYAAPEILVQKNGMLDYRKKSLCMYF